MELTGLKTTVVLERQQEPGKMIHGKMMEDLNRLKWMGNKAGGGVLSNTWDEENRLVSCESAAAVTQAAEAKERWTYYADGRWKERVIYINNLGAWTATTTNRFVWDGKVIRAILNLVCLCKPCEIYILSCHVGNGKIGQGLANGSGCTVYAPSGFCFPNYKNPDKSKIKPKDTHYPDYNPSVSGDCFVKFTPQ